MRTLWLAAALALLSITAEAQTSEVVGNCLVIHVGTARPVGKKTKDFCVAQAASLPRTKGTRIQDLYGDLAPFLVKAFQDADAAVCGIIQCANPLQGANLVVHFGFPVNAFESANGTETFVTIGINSALLDVTETTVAALVRDAVADQNGAAPEDGYMSFLLRMRSNGGRPCRTPIRYPKLNRDSTKAVPVNPRAPPQVVYLLIFGHELAHAHTAQALCGYKGQTNLGREMSCDSLSFVAVSKKIGMLPPIPISVAVAMSHSDALYSPLYFSNVATTDLPDLLQVRNWRERAGAWLRAWRQECLAGNGTVMCRPGWATSEAYSSNLLKLPLPSSCTGGWEGVGMPTKLNSRKP
jgi:hypothetical protein